MKTNEFVCKKCREAYYKKWAPGGWGSVISRSEIVTEGCAQLLHAGRGDYTERHLRWFFHEIADDCPYILELMVLNEDE
jgi:hypothetical protein